MNILLNQQNYVIKILRRFAKVLKMFVCITNKIWLHLNCESSKDKVV